MISQSASMLSPDSDGYWLDILKSNVGFERPERWVNYAKAHGFRKVAATEVRACPDCGEPVSRTRKIGQYVYYSNLGQLRECDACHLVFSTLRIEPQVIRSHFEYAYNDEEYFLRRRKDIFDQVVGEIALHAPAHGYVLDIGGAKGHTMAALKRVRPDLTIVVNDLSPSKCEWAESRYGLQSLCGSAHQLLSCSMTFDVISLIDVMYYEPDISKLWEALHRLLKPQATVMLRIPNNYFRIMCRERLLKFFGRGRYGEMADRISSFNPEHLYVLSQQYVTKRLRCLGFGKVDWKPSSLLLPNRALEALPRLYRSVAEGVHLLSKGRGTITPGVLVVASERQCNRDV